MFGGDFRASLPRFSGENLATNRTPGAGGHGLAQQKGCSAAQMIALPGCWRNGGMVPIPAPAHPTRSPAERLTRVAWGALPAEG